MTDQPRWEDIAIDRFEKETRKYRRHIGSGRSWLGRGLFQLELLKWLGLTRNHSVLDFGCGPFRAAEHLIWFLDHGRYVGVDVNRDFIDICMLETKRFNFEFKKPRFLLLDDFDFKQSVMFDFIIIFSVFNHLPIDETKKIVLQLMKPDGKINDHSTMVISNAWWIDSDFMDFLYSNLDLDKENINFYFAEDIDLGKDIEKTFGIKPKNFPFAVISH